MKSLLTNYNSIIRYINIATIAEPFLVLYRTLFRKVLESSSERVLRVYGECAVDGSVQNLLHQRGFILLSQA